MCVPLNLNIPLLSYSKPEHLTVSYAHQSGDSSTQTSPFSTFCAITLRHPDENCPHNPFYTLNASSNFSQAPLYSHSSKLYSDDDLFTFMHHKSFSSFNNNTIFKRAPNFLPIMNESFSSSISLNAQQSISSTLSLVASISGSIAACIGYEYKLGYLHLL